MKILKNHQKLEYLTGFILQLEVYFSKEETLESCEMLSMINKRSNDFYEEENRRHYTSPQMLTNIKGDVDEVEDSEEIINNSTLKYSKQTEKKQRDSVSN